MAGSRSSPLVAIVAIIIIVGCVFAVRNCSRSARSGLREKLSWRACLDCGNMWQMDIAESRKQQLKDPGGSRRVQCPQCKAWKGVPVADCAKCGKRIPKRKEVRAADGSIYYVERKHCDKCERSQGQ